MFQFLALSLGASLVLLLGAAELERRAIVARRMGPNGRAMLAALAISAVASLGVIGVAAYSTGWIYLLHLVGATVAYHGFMGVFLVHGLQEVSARVASQPLQRSATRQTVQTATKA
ncbi:hypothetical protein LHP98_16965 [Rhodobacter sp. Har01]|uniref:hypothetical protein n=1 Tax=Rhodobacter sp. Har01 TaxID=2883999 RepID=UPI001D074D37|nr:hypothetical protein [Rhodobacter sp. Har01]MCB6179814.1 hypothetical protein [Rhodobacter sp. Har01]